MCKNQAKLQELRKELERRWLPEEYIDRYIQELEAHFEDARKDQNNSDAETEALLNELGGIDELANEAQRRMQIDFLGAVTPLNWTVGGWVFAVLSLLPSMILILHASRQLYFMIQAPELYFVESEMNWLIDVLTLIDLGIPAITLLGMAPLLRWLKDRSFSRMQSSILCAGLLVISFLITAVINQLNLVFAGEPDRECVLLFQPEPFCGLLWFL